LPKKSDYSFCRKVDVFAALSNMKDCGAPGEEHWLKFQGNPAGILAREAFQYGIAKRL
jgi:hypothetical protein